MIELIQFPWSPYCLVQRHILEYSGVRYKITNLPRTGDRNLVWRLTREKSYSVPVIKDGRRVIYETGEETQDIAKYIDRKLGLDLFPPELEGLQSILWRQTAGELLQKLEASLQPYEQMLQMGPFLLGTRPCFVDFELFGMLENLRFSGHYQLPSAHTNLQTWHRRLAVLKIAQLTK